MGQNKYKLSTETRLQLRNMRQNMNLVAENVSMELGKSKAWLGQIERGKLFSIKKNDLEKLISIYSTCNENKSIIDNVLKKFGITNNMTNNMEIKFEWSKELCNKISDSKCLEPREMQIVEIALRLYECYEEILNENLGLDLVAKRETNFFQLEHAIHRNSSKRSD